MNSECPRDDSDIDPVEGLPSRAHPPVWGRFDERATKPDTSVQDDPEASEEGKIHYLLGGSIDEPGAFYHKVVPTHPTRNYTPSAQRVTCGICLTEMQAAEHDEPLELRLDRGLRSFRDVIRARQDRREQQDERTPGERAKALLRQPNSTSSFNHPEVEHLARANTIAEAQVWATLELARVTERTAQDEETVTFHSGDGLEFSRESLKERLEHPSFHPERASTHYTIHTDGSITNNMTGKTYEPGESIEDVMSDESPMFSKNISTPIDDEFIINPSRAKVVIHETPAERMVQALLLRRARQRDSDDRP